MPVVFSGIAPHPPLLIPEVGGNRIDQVAESQQALREFSRRLIATKPDSVVVVSPHSPMDPSVFTARSAAQLAGDFRDFYARQVSLTFPNDLALISAIQRSAINEGGELALHERDYALDHGAMVPLYYLHEAGWSGPVVVIGFTDQSKEKHLAFGRAIANGARELDRRVAMVASGDLSHRLLVGGPYEFEPTAHLFDEQIVDAISRGRPSAMMDIDPGLISRAGECGYRSIVVALGTVEGVAGVNEVLSYEGPFGVGYLVAVLWEKKG